MAIEASRICAPSLKETNKNCAKYLSESVQRWLTSARMDMRNYITRNYESSLQISKKQGLFSQNGYTLSGVQGSCKLNMRSLKKETMTTQSTLRRKDLGECSLHICELEYGTSYRLNVCVPDPQFHMLKP